MSIINSLLEVEGCAKTTGWKVLVYNRNIYIYIHKLKAKTLVYLLVGRLKRERSYPVASQPVFQSLEPNELAFSNTVHTAMLL